MKDATTLCIEAGFDPNDPVQWNWWKSLSETDQKQLAVAMDRAKMPTFTDLGIRDIQANARPRR
jgi:hypothetical protein